MSNRIGFLTGICGQDGSYLAEFLLEKGYKVYGMIRRSSSLNTGRIEHIKDKLILKYGDITDISSITNILSEISKLEYDILEIYNLSAQSHVQVSFELPLYTGQVDAIGTLNLLEAVRILNLKNCKIYQASTSELYGKQTFENQNELTPFQPSSPYACAKLYAYHICKIYRESYGMFICNGILFNHESKRRGFNFVSRKITLGLGKILRGEEDMLVLGNLDSVRDWSHAKDMVYGMWLMLQQENPDVFVLASGETHTIREFVEKAFSLKGFKIIWQGNEGYDEITNKHLITTDKKYMRPIDVDYLKGDYSKAKRILDWQPSIPFDELVKEMVDHDCS